MSNIETLQNTKGDIKNVLSSTGKPFVYNGMEFFAPLVTLTGGMVTYPDVIRNKYNVLIGYDMSWIYDENESMRCNLFVWN